MVDRAAKTRDITFDLAKCVAIYMVIVWHCYPGNWHATDWASALPVNLIIGCNMPLFFLISGYFARRMFLTCDWRALVVRLIGYLWPVFIFSLLDTGVAYFHDPQLSVWHKWAHIFMTCFWFFCCLSLCEVTTYFAFWANKYWKVSVIGLLAAVFLLFWIIPLGVYYYVAMVPFYWFGVFALPLIYERKYACAVGVVCLFVYVVFAFIEGDITTNGLGFYWDRMRLWDPSWIGFVRMMARYLMGLLGAGGCLLALKAVGGRSAFVRTLAMFGTTTLGVYFLHRYAVMEWYRIPIASQVGIGVYCGLSVAVLFACHCLVRASNKVEWLKFIFWGPGPLVKRYLARKEW